MVFPVTSVYAIPLVILGIFLWFRVTLMRAQLNISIGDASNPALLQRVRQHGNFIEWVPMVLVLMMIAEGNGASALWLHASGGLLLIGRLIHPFGLKINHASHPMRIVGNSASLLATVTLLTVLLVSSFQR